MAVPAWHKALSGLDVLIIMLVMGLCVTRLWVVPAAAATPAFVRRARSVLLGYVALLTLTSAAVLLARVHALSGAGWGELWRYIGVVISATDFGHFWLLRVAAVLVLWCCVGWAMRVPRQRWVYAVATIMIVLVAYTRSATGHAGDHGNFTLAVWMDWLHLIAAGVWGGMIVAYVLVAHHTLKTAVQRLRTQAVKHFSNLAALGLGGVLVTGIYSAWNRIGAWHALWTTHYGLILLAKLALVLVLALLGATNRFWHVPGAVQGRELSFKRLAVTACIEACIVAAVVATVALMVNAMPPADM